MEFKEVYSENLLNFSKETTEHYPEILTDEAMTFLSKSRRDIRYLSD